MTDDKPRPSRDEAEEAVRTLLRWAGEDPNREGLLDTPTRVTKAYGEWFRGYNEDPAAILERTFEEVDGYDEMVVLKDIRFESFCEHHMAPIIGKAHVGYLPTDRVVGISKLVRMSVLSSMDRLLGCLFGAVRGIILIAIFIIGGQFAGFDNDDWWEDSKLLPHLQVVADWIKVMAPQGLEIITPDDAADSLPVDIPIEV